MINVTRIIFQLQRLTNALGAHWNNCSPVYKEAEIERDGKYRHAIVHYSFYKETKRLESHCRQQNRWRLQTEELFVNIQFIKFQLTIVQVSKYGSLTLQDTYRPTNHLWNISLFYITVLLSLIQWFPPPQLRNHTDSFTSIFSYKKVIKLRFPYKHSDHILKSDLKTVLNMNCFCKFSEWETFYQGGCALGKSYKTEFYKQLLILIEVLYINSSHDFTAYKTAGLSHFMFQI